MADVKITPERIRELEKAERKLQALENAGVDNWGGYDFALEEIRKEDEHKEFLEEVVDEIIDAISDCIEEPAGRCEGRVSCGYGITAHGSTNIFEILKKYNLAKR